MRILEDVDLFVDVIGGDQNVLSDLSDRIHTHRRPISSVDEDHVGRVEREDLSTGGAPHAGERLGGIVCMLAGQRGGDPQRDHMLARTACALDDVGV